MKVDQICGYLNQFAPPRLAEDWDNVGLLVGDRQRVAERVMTCLTVTPGTVDEAVAERAGLIVTHHPIPFRPLKRLTADSVTGRLLLTLIEHGIAVYSPHTAFDSTGQGINQQLAEGLRLEQIAPLQPFPDDPAALGAGRWGRLAQTLPLQTVVDRLAQFLAIDRLQFVGAAQQQVTKVGVACGSAGQFLSDAQRLGCDAFVTGEATFHTCLQAEAEGVGLILTGHYASERFAVERLAERLAEEFSPLTVWASRAESDPLQLFWRDERQVL